MSNPAHDPRQLLINAVIGKVRYSTIYGKNSGWRQSPVHWNVASDICTVKDELGTEKLFKSMLGKVYTVRGFDKYGNVELVPKRLNTVWVEPEFLKLVAPKPKKRSGK